MTEIRRIRVAQRKDKQTGSVYSLVIAVSQKEVPYRIELERRKELINQPEFGIGFQYLAHAGNLVILNAEVAIEFDEIDRSFEWLMDVNKFEDSKERQQKLEILAPCTGDLQTRERHSYPSFTESNEKFIRYSASSQDNCIRRNGPILSRTYATSDNALTMALSGLAAVSRSAHRSMDPHLSKFE